jgi:hypothetical protein
VETDPPGAEVFVNGERVGHSPVGFTDPPGWSREYELTLKKDGYELHQVTLVQDVINTPMVAAAVVLGVCTAGVAAIYFVPRSRQLEDRYRYALKRKTPLPPLEAPDPAPPSAPPGEAPAVVPGGPSPARETAATPIRY